MHVLGMPPAFVLSQDQTLRFTPNLNPSSQDLTQPDKPKPSATVDPPSHYCLPTIPSRLADQRLNITEQPERCLLRKDIETTHQPTSVSQLNRNTNQTKTPTTSPLYLLKLSKSKARAAPEPACAARVATRGRPVNIQADFRRATPFFVTRRKTSRKAYIAVMPPSMVRFLPVI